MRERRRRYSLFYFEQIGSRSYLRITRLGLILVLLFTVIPIIALLSLFLINRSTPTPDVDVTVRPMPAADTLPYPATELPSPPLLRKQSGSRRRSSRRRPPSLLLP